MKVNILRLVSDAKIPTFATPNSSGADLYSIEDKIIQPNEWCLIKTGIAIECNGNRVDIQIRPRSGLALKHGITVLNAPATIDGDYRGELGVILVNHSDKPFKVENGMRIAQLVFSKLVPVEFEEVNELSKTERGVDGFGSTGIK